MLRCIVKNFSSSARVVFDFNTYSSELGTVGAVENTVYDSGVANIVQGFDLLTNGVGFLLVLKICLLYELFFLSL